MQTLTNTTDRTDDPEWVMENFDRLVKHELIHGLLCRGITFTPSKLAECTGVDTDCIHEILNGVKSKLSVYATIS